MRVGFDVDGVIANFTVAFTRLAHDIGEKTNLVRQEDQQEWKFPFHVDRVWREVERTQNWWMTLDPLVDEAEIAFINDCIATKYTCFITNRKQTAGLPIEEQTRQWLRGIGINASNVFAVDHKGPLCGALALDWFVEDKIANLESIRDGGVLAIARSWAYNERWQGRRVSHLTQLREVNARE